MPQETEIPQTDADIRQAVASEVFGEAAGTPPDPIEPVAEPVANPWIGVSPALRTEIESLRVQAGNVATFEGRLKESERRIGSFTNEWHAAKQAAKAVAEAPTAAQMDAAKTSLDEWNVLKEDFPEWGTGIENRLAAERAEILKLTPNAEAIRAEIAGVEDKFSERLVRSRHPKFVERINSPEFAAWREANGNVDSTDPLEVIQIMDDFEASQKGKKPTRQIVEERDQRLAQSQTTQGRKLPPVKSEADMSEDELRNSIAKEVWGGA